MSRPKGSKNKAKKSTAAKCLIAKEVKAIKVKGSKEKAVNVISFEEQIKSVLSHILELFKAALTDAFRQYVAARMDASAPASVEFFTSQFKNTVAIHGFDNSVLLDSLDEVQLEYVNNSAKQPAIPQTQNVPHEVSNGQVNKAPVPESKKEVTSVFDSLDII